MNIYGLNMADLIVIAILLIGLISGLSKGLVGMALKLVYSVASFGGAIIFYPVVSKLIRSTPLFDLIQNSILTSLDLDTKVEVFTKQQEVNIINSLNLPDFIKEKLLENNNSVIYELLGTDSFFAYIAGFLTNMLINLVIVAVLFALFLLVLRIVFKGIELLAKLPIINGINKLGGAAAGLMLSVIIIWICFGLVSAFITKPAIYNIYECISASKVAILLYENNLLLHIVLKRMF